MHATKAIGTNGILQICLRHQTSQPNIYFCCDEFWLWAAGTKLCSIWLRRCVSRRLEHGANRIYQCQLDWSATTTILRPKVKVWGWSRILESPIEMSKWCMWRGTISFTKRRDTLLSQMEYIYLYDQSSFLLNIFLMPSVEVATFTYHPWSVQWYLKYSTKFSSLNSLLFSLIVIGTPHHCHKKTFDDSHSQLTVSRTRCKSVA